MEPEKTPRKRAEDLISLLVPEWRPTPRQGLWAIRIGIVLGLLVAIGYSYGITLWDWVKLLIVPAVIAAGGLWFNRQQQERQRRDNQQQQQRERELAERRSQDEALQAYLDAMSQLLTDEKWPLHRAQPGDNISTVARARTLTVLTRLDGSRKGSVVKFLYESKLIERPHPIVRLEGAELSQAFRETLPHIEKKMNLRRADLSGADLSNAYLGDADLTEANLKNADLWSGATLVRAKLVRADLRGAELIPRTDLAYADLEGADLREAVLAYYHSPARFHSRSGAAYAGPLDSLTMSYTPKEANPKMDTILEGTNLKGANLCHAILADKQLAKCKSLEGATMPDGQILRGPKTPNGPTFEDWLKDRESRKEVGENDGSS